MRLHAIAMSFVLLVASLGTINAQNIGIGETSPGSKFTVKGNLSIGSSYSTLSTAPTDGAIIQGNVGIGNSNPTGYKLDVTGTGRFTSNLTIGAYTLPAVDGTNGYVLTTNGSGVVSWVQNGTGAVVGYNMSSGRDNAPDFSYSTSSSFSNSTSGSIPDGTGASLTRTFTVSGVSTPLAHLTISMSVTHNKDADLTITLTSPSGTVVTLTQANGGTGKNYITTTFDDLGTTAITAGTAPFNGTYTPQSALSAFAGETANGTWTLTITDGTATNTGTFNSATLNVFGETANFYTFVGEVAVPVTSGETAYVDGYYSSKTSGTGLALKITRSTTSGSGSIGSIVGYSASNAGSGNKYYNASVKDTDSGLATGTYYYKMWIAGYSGTITTGTENYHLLVNKSH